VKLDVVPALQHFLADLAHEGRFAYPGAAFNNEDAGGVGLDYIIVKRVKTVGRVAAGENFFEFAGQAGMPPLVPI